MLMLMLSLLSHLSPRWAPGLGGGLDVTQRAVLEPVGRAGRGAGSGVGSGERETPGDAVSGGLRGRPAALLPLQPPAKPKVGLRGSGNRDGITDTPPTHTHTHSLSAHGPGSPRRALQLLQHQDQRDGELTPLPTPTPTRGLSTCRGTRPGSRRGPAPPGGQSGGSADTGGETPAGLSTAGDWSRAEPRPWTRNTRHGRDRAGSRPDAQPGAMPGPPQALRGVCAWAALLACDLALWAGLEQGSSLLLPAPRGPFAPERLARLWLLAGLRLAALWRLAGGARRRGLAALCLLGPAYESGRLALGGRPLGAGGPGFAALRLGATTAAALFWEGSFPEGGALGGGERAARGLFLRVLRLYRPDLLPMGAAFVFLALAVLCEMFIPFYTGKVIDILGSQYQQSSFLMAILFMGLFSIGSSLCAGCRGGLFMCCIAGFSRRIKVLLFGALVRQEVGFFETTKTGDLTSRLATDTRLMGMTVALNVNVLLRTLVRTVGMLALMVSLSWKLTLLMLMETPVTGMLQNVHDTYYQRLSKEVQDSVARANEAAGESVSGIRTLRSFNTEESEARRYDSRLEDTHLLKTRRDTVRAVYLLLRRLVSLGMQVIMLYYGRLFIQTGQMTTGNLVSFLLYQMDLGRSIRTLIYVFGDMLNSVGAAGKVFEYLDRRPQVCAEGSLQPPSLRGHVQFRNVTFCYPSRPDRPALQGLSMDLKAGQITALVGLSGGGKTTCVSLLERFYEPQEGEILLDGHPLQDYKHSYLHSKVSMVGQEPVLFSGSIRDNIAYGLPDCPLERVQRAAESANAHKFISALEQGYDTDVGERGAQLSGGEKQRIAIARALIRDPQILILDEATSCLDADSEHAIQQALSGCSRTVLVVAHRLKTVERADQIIVIDGGRVLEQGTHQELMASGGSYYRLRERLFTEENGDQ